MDTKLGDTVKDRVTKFKGVVVGKVEYLTGCKQSLIVPEVKEDGTYVEGHWFDNDRLEAVPGVAPIVIKVEDNGPDLPAPRY